MVAIKSPTQLVVLATALAVAATSAQAASPTLEGTYALDAKASDVIEVALAQTFSDFDTGTRSVTIDFFKQRHPAYSQTKIEHSEKEVVVTFDSGNPMRMPIDGAAVPWTREDGKTLEIKGQWTSTKLIQTIDTMDTLRVNEFALSADGATLTLKVDFTGYPKPLKYQLVYRRSSER